MVDHCKEPMKEIEPSHSRRKSPYRSELFTLQMWCEVLNDHFEWRGKVRHIGSHKESYFRDWEPLVVFIREILLSDPKQSGNLLDDQEGENGEHNKNNFQ